jgi:hypothetical protein
MASERFQSTGLVDVHSMDHLWRAFEAIEEAFLPALLGFPLTRLRLEVHEEQGPGARTTTEPRLPPSEQGREPGLFRTCCLEGRGALS